MGYYQYIGDPSLPKECRYNHSSTSNEACRAGHCPGELPNKRNGVGCPLKSDGTPYPDINTRRLERATKVQVIL